MNKELITRPQSLNFLRYVDPKSEVKVHLEEFFYGDRINSVRYTFKVRFDRSYSDVLLIDFDVWRAAENPYKLSQKQSNLLTKAKMLQHLAMMNPIAYDIQRESEGLVFECDQDSLPLCYDEVPYLFLDAQNWALINSECD
jgi:hypothetical protein